MGFRPIGYTLLSFLFFAACAQKETSRQPNSVGEKMVRDFQKKVQLKPGQYSLQEGSSDDCLEGEVELLSIENTHLSLMVGGQLLVSEFGLKPRQIEYQDRACKREAKTELQGQQLQSWEKRTCVKKDQDRLVQKRVQFLKNRIDYVIEQEPGTPRSVSCELVKQ